MFIARRRSSNESTVPGGAANAAPSIVPTGARDDASATSRAAERRGSDLASGDGGAERARGTSGTVNAVVGSQPARERAGATSTSVARKRSFNRSRTAKEDTLNALLEKLCAIDVVDEDSRGSMEDDGALRERVETEARSANPADFLKFRNAVHERVDTMITGEDIARKLGGLRAIDQLIEVEFGEAVVAPASASLIGVSGTAAGLGDVTRSSTLSPLTLMSGSTLHTHGEPLNSPAHVTMPAAYVYRHGVPVKTS